MYKEIKLKGELVGIQRLSNNDGIPLDLDNTDYQQYLQWIAEGNIPLPADEVK